MPAGKKRKRGVVEIIAESPPFKRDLESMKAHAVAIAATPTAVYAFIHGLSLTALTFTHQFDSFRELLQDPAFRKDLVGTEFHIFATRRHFVISRTYMTRVATM